MFGSRIRAVVLLTAALALGLTGVAMAGKKKHHKPPKKHHAAKKHHKPKPPTKPRTKPPKTKTSAENTIAITGPTANVFHHDFNETVSGNATGNANYVISGEQLYPSGGAPAPTRPREPSATGTSGRPGPARSTASSRRWRSSTLATTTSTGSART